jgi:hypothetical protein
MNIHAAPIKFLEAMLYETAHTKAILFGDFVAPPTSGLPTIRELSDEMGVYRE